MTAPMHAQLSQRMYDEATRESGAIWRDQLGNFWHTEIEKKTGDSCGPITPHGRRCPPPWIPPSGQYFVRPKRSLSGRSYVSPNDVEIDFDRMIADNRAAWEQQRRDIEGYKAANPTWTAAFIQHKVASPAWHPRVLVEAKRGNEYLHGLRPFDPSNAMDVWLKQYVDPSTVHDEVSDFDWIPAKSPIPGTEAPAPVELPPLSPMDELDLGEQVRALKATNPKHSYKQIGAKLGISGDEARRLAELEAAIPGDIED
jgi:hypothetical protein